MLKRVVAKAAPGGPYKRTKKVRKERELKTKEQMEDDRKRIEEMFRRRQQIQKERDDSDAYGEW